MEDGKKINKIYLFLTFLAIILLAVGISFAYFMLAGQEEEDSTQIWTGTLYINYVDGKTINVFNLYPIDEPNLNSDSYVYQKSFSVESSGSLDQTLDLYIDITKNEFISDHLMYAIYDENGNKMNSGSISKEGKVLMTSDVYLKSHESKPFTVLIWLKETGENQDDEQDCSFNGEFDIYAEQIKYE